MLSDEVRRLANGKWFELLTKLGGIDPDCLLDRHGPCPLCGGEDRWRWDDREGDGGGFCNKCGGKQEAGGAISGFDLLMRSKGWEFKEAASEVKRFLGGEVVATTKRGKPARIPEKPPFGADAPRLGKAVAQWCYTDSQGDQLYWIQRFEDPSKPDKRGKPKKTMVHRTWLDGKWHFPKRTDAFTSEWPSPRPLLGQYELTRRPEAPVLVVEGETTFDAACLLFSQHVVITWSNGSKAVGRVDWSPLAGRNVTIWPDNDQDGEQCATKLVGILHGIGADSVSVVTPPAGVPVGWDLADAEDWDEAEANAHLDAHSAAVEVVDASGDTKPPAQPGGNGGATPSKRPFGLLGFAGDNFYYQPDESGQVTIIARAKHSATNMLGLARLSYWQKEYPRFNKDGDFVGIDWQGSFDDLFAAQYRIGFFDPDKVRGLGAWWDDGRVVLHLGDRLIVDGAVHYLTKPFESKYCYQRLRRLEGPGKAVPLSDGEAMQVLEIAATFMWEDKSSAFLLSGWLALAPICGALAWRPHAWLTAAAGSGKSTILERFVGVLLGDMFVQPEGKSTEPSIRQELMSSALAVVLDEAEQKEGDKVRIQSILDFARSCSSEGKGQIMKGSSDQSGAKKFRAKAMFLMSSVATALKEGADKSRFAQLTLRKNEHLTEAQRSAQWIELDRVLRDLITEEFALRLIARTINLIPMIRDASKVFATAAAEHLGTQRLGDQYGALSAGAWSLCHQQAPTLDEARAWLKANPLTAHAEASEVADEKSCLQTILEHQIRVDVDGGAKNRTVLALVRIVRNRTITGEEGIDDKKAERALGRLGIRVDSGRLEISNTAKGLRKLLRETAWESCWPTVLSRMEGATKPGAVWFPEIGTSRATSLPMPDLE